MTTESDETKIAVLVEKVGNMNITLTKLDGKLDTMTDKFATKDQITEVDKRLGDHDSKIDNLENWKNRMLGALVVVQVVWGAVIFFITGHKP